MVKQKILVFSIGLSLCALLFLPEAAQEQVLGSKRQFGKPPPQGFYPFSSRYIFGSASNCCLNSPVISATENLLGGDIISGCFFDNQAAQLLLPELFQLFSFHVAADTFPKLCFLVRKQWKYSHPLQRTMDQTLMNNEKATATDTYLCRKILM